MRRKRTVVVGDRPGFVAVFAPWTAEVAWVPAAAVRCSLAEAERDAREARALVASLTALSDPPAVEIYGVVS